MPGIQDVFAADAFSQVELTALLNDMPHKPRRLGEMGLFQSRGVRTLKVSIERQGSVLKLVQTTPRNTPPIQNEKRSRDLVDVPTSRIALGDAVTADEVQGVRAAGTESDLKTLQDEVLERGSDISDSIMVTEEHQRIGAVKGTVLDADGSTLINLATTFGVTLQSEIGWNIAAVAEGGLRTLCSALIRQIEDELGGLSYDSIHVMCSSQFFDDIVAHPDVREANKGFESGRDFLMGRTARRTQQYAGVTFEEYRGAVGGTKYVADDKAHAFPIGVSSLFVSRYAPAEYWDTVNTPGLPRYMRMMPDPAHPDSRMLIDVRSQGLHICTRPRTLVPLRRGA